MNSYPSDFPDSPLQRTSFVQFANENGRITLTDREIDGTMRIKVKVQLRLRGEERFQK